MLFLLTFLDIFLQFVSSFEQDKMNRALDKPSFLQPTLPLHKPPFAPKLEKQNQK